MGHTRKRQGKPQKKIIRIEIPDFITHVPLSKTKYRKINGQNVYSGMNPHIRAKLMRELHDFLRPYVKKSWDLTPPRSVRLEFHVPVNFGSVKRVMNKKTGKSELQWKEPVNPNEATWDVDNQWIWTKAFNDVLVQEKVISDDNVTKIQSSGEIKWVPVDHIDDRKLVFVIQEV